MDKVKDPKIVAIGEAIAHHRRVAGLTQTQLAEASGTGIATVQRAETGVNTLNKTTFARIAKVLGVTVADLGGEVRHSRDDALSMAQLRTVTIEQIVEELRRRNIEVTMKFK